MTEFYHIDWIRFFDVPLTGFTVEVGRQTIEFEDREPGDGLNVFELDMEVKTRETHPTLRGTFMSCNNDRKRWFLNVFAEQV